MSVIVETSLGDFTIDLFTDERPKCCKNFLKLCKVKYYNYCLFHSVQRNFIAQTGDPTGTGKEGESIYGVLYGDQARYFDWEFVPKIKHAKSCLVSMVNNRNNMHGSQFFITLGESLDYLDGVHTVFGEVTEGLDVIAKLNEAYCDEKYRPFRDVRIHHTIILDDPYDDPPGLDVPDRSPSPTKEVIERARLAADAELDDMEGKTEEEVREIMEEREEKANAQILEMIGDLPSTDISAPENVLFVCKLNSVTTDEDLEIIFSRFGAIKSCEVIRDQKTGESLQYAFIEFEKKEYCESAYFKMDNVLIDDRRIHVDFSQSVSKLKWKGKGRGVETLTDEPKQPRYVIKDKSQRQDNNYDLVFEENGNSKSSKRKHRDRSPDNYKKKQTYRSRSRSPNRKIYGSSERDRRNDTGRTDDKSDRYSPPQRNRGGRYSLPRNRGDRYSPPRGRDSRESPPPRYRDKRGISPPRRSDRQSPPRYRNKRDMSPQRVRGYRESPPRYRDKRGMSPKRDSRDLYSASNEKRYRSPPRNKSRLNPYDGSSSEEETRGQNKTKKKKYKSSDEDDVREGQKRNKKRTQESSDEESEETKKKLNKKRHASSSDEEERKKSKKKKKVKNDSSDENNYVKKKKKKKKDEQSEDNVNVNKKKKKKRKKEISSEDEEDAREIQKHFKIQEKSDLKSKYRRESDSQSPPPKRTDKYSSKEGRGREEKHRGRDREDYDRNRR